MSAPSRSHYNALYLKLQRRFSQRRQLPQLVLVRANRSTTAAAIRTTDGDSLTPSNNYDLGLETGLSAFDFRQRWTTSWLWDLPFGKNRALLNHGGVVDFVLGGWQLGGILTLQDGFPFTVQCGPGNIQNGGGVCYPDSTGVDWQLPAERATRTRYFNTAAFVDRNPATGPFRYGTVPRNSLIGPGIISLDASANKRFTDGFEIRRGSHRGLQSAQPPDLESAGQSAANAQLRRASPARGSTRGRFRSG